MTNLYETQRAMRRMLQTARQRGVVALLDIGSSKIACVILRFEGGERKQNLDEIGPMAQQSQLRILGHAVTRSRGVRFGEISEMSATESAIRMVLQASQKKANLRVDHVIVCFSGGFPQSYALGGETEVSGATVHGRDVALALAACDMPDIGPRREVLHAQPVNFSLDHRSGLADPRGQIGHRLGCDMHMLTVASDVVQNLFHAIKRCDLELAGLVSSAYVSGLSSLAEDEQELGGICLDMGAGTTGLSIFMKKHMIYAGSVRMGGDLITSDISKVLEISTATAERIKTKHGGVLATSMDDREMIEIGGNSGDWDKDRRQVSRAELIGIIRPRVEEILEEVLVSLEQSEFDLLPSRQIVLTGGGSQLAGLDGLAGRILGPRVRLGRPLRIQSLPPAMSGPDFSAIVGLCLFATFPKDEWWDFDILSEKYPAGSVKRVFRWLKDIW